MMCSSSFWRRAAAATVIIAGASLVMAGCSSMGPEASMEPGTGDVAGTVTTQRGVGVSDIAVTLHADFSDTEYTAQTSQTGTFTVSDLTMGAKHAYSEVYEVWVNRTPTSSTPIDDEYATYSGSVVVGKDQTASISVVLPRIDDGPGDPEQIVDGS